MAAEVCPTVFVAKQGLDIKLIYGTGQDRYSAPDSDKGLAMQFLRQQWGVTQSKRLCVATLAMTWRYFLGEERGIIVGNASSELLRWHNASQLAIVTQLKLAVRWYSGRLELFPFPG